jgi:AP-2 complex subunit alpha
MTLGILLHENHELIPLIVNSCKVDLDSRNSMYQALALSAIANIGGKEMSESLAPAVLKILALNTTKVSARTSGADSHSSRLCRRLY